MCKATNGRKQVVKRKLNPDVRTCLTHKSYKSYKSIWTNGTNGGITSILKRSAASITGEKRRLPRNTSKDVPP
jgi:hypothetical protein